LTFISTNHAIIHAGYYPVFADIEPETGNISSDSIIRLMGSSFLERRVKCLLVVHYGGLPVDMDAMYDIAEKYQLQVIEDAAHAFGAKYQDSNIGCRYSRMTCFSLHSVKPLAIGDGGLLTTYDPAIDKHARLLRWCGIDKSTNSRMNSAGYSWDYDVKYSGFKYHMNDIQAAIGLGQLLHYDEDKAYRQVLVNTYREELKNVEEIEMLFCAFWPEYFQLLVVASENFSDNRQDDQPMTDFADRFRVRYSTLNSVWKALAEGETPEHFPVEWKSINYKE
jgi:perosamine synthetase